MSAPNVDNIYRSPGRLVMNPTALTSPYPHGGTELGIARDIAFVPHVTVRELVAEEFRQPVEAIITGARPIISGVMRTWDDDMMNKLFYGASQDSFGRTGLHHNVQTHRAGYRLSQRSIVLLFSPDAVDLRKHILLYNAIPVVDEAFQMRNSLNDEFGLPFFFLGLPDSQGRDYAVDLRQNLTL